MDTSSESRCFGAKYESDSLFMDSGTYCRACHSSNHATSKCRHLKKHIQFVESGNRNYEARFGMERDHRRQTQYPAGHYYPPPPTCQSPPRTFKKNFYNEGRNKRCGPRHGPGSNRSYSNAPTHRAANAVQHFDSAPSSTRTKSKNQTLRVPG